MDINGITHPKNDIQKNPYMWLSFQNHCPTCQPGEKYHVVSDDMPIPNWSLKRISPHYSSSTKFSFQRWSWMSSMKFPATNLRFSALNTPFHSPARGLKNPMWGGSINGGPLVIIYFRHDFSLINHPFLDIPIFWNLSIYSPLTIIDILHKTLTIINPYQNWFPKFFRGTPRKSSILV